MYYRLWSIPQSTNIFKWAKYLKECVWFEGTVRKYDAEDDLYWVLCSDGDTEDDQRLCSDQRCCYCYCSIT
jgi:hypothetical protein